MGNEGTNSDKMKEQLSKWNKTIAELEEKIQLSPGYQKIRQQKQTHDSWERSKLSKQKDSRLWLRRQRRRREIEKWG